MNDILGPKIQEMLELLFGNIKKESILAIILYGGLVRDRVLLDGWSDIDIIIIYKVRDPNYFRVVASIIDYFEQKYKIRLDITHLSEDDIKGDQLRNLYNSEILNALAFRNNVSSVIYGDILPILVPRIDEELSARLYIVNTQLAIRRFLVEEVYRNENMELLKNKLPRMIRWNFSIVRAGLRLFNIYVHPYDESIKMILNLQWPINIDLLYRLVDIRRNFTNFHLFDRALFDEITEFSETYINFVLSNSRV